MKKIIFLVSVMSMLLSCKTHRISDSDKEWQPYRKGDVLLFQSNKGEHDTIVVESIESYVNPDDPLSIFPTRIQSLFVIGTRGLLEMQASEKGGYIEFDIRIGDNKLVYPVVVVSIQELEEMALDSNGQYVIEAKEHYDNLKDHPFDLKYIYWSKKYGYLGLEFKDDYTWSLKSFIRNGKKIL